MRGSILNELAYSQGKMLMHDSWIPVLPKKITACDFDMVLDDRGAILLAEISKDCHEWRQKKMGQRLAYEAVVKNMRTDSIACLCFHSVPSTDRVDTRWDIESVQVMFWHKSLRSIHVSELLDADDWRTIVEGWFKRREYILRVLHDLASESIANCRFEPFPRSQGRLFESGT